VEGAQSTANHQELGMRPVLVNAQSGKPPALRTKAALALFFWDLFLRKAGRAAIFLLF
jgi:hypothetical protein